MQVSWEDNETGIQNDIVTEWQWDKGTGGKRKDNQTARSGAKTPTSATNRITIIFENESQNSRLSGFIVLQAEAGMC